MNKEEYFLMVEQNIKEHGCHLTYVFEDELTPSFCYSTGLYLNYKIPEIFISGLPQNLSFNLANDYAAKYKTGNEEINLKTKISGIWDQFEVILIEVDKNDLKDYVLTSFRFYEDQDFKYLQLVYPDTKGFYPNEEGYNYLQELFNEMN
jgi:hypothetical protein